MAISDILPWNRKKDEIEIQKDTEQDSFLALQDEMDSLFDEFFNQPFGLLRRPSKGFEMMSKFSPKVDVSETAKAINIEADLPGMEAEDIELELHNDRITIKGEKKTEKEKKDKQFYRVERSYGSFHRNIPLPNEINMEKAKANFKNGVLSVELPKAKSTQSRRKINIKSGS